MLMAISFPPPTPYDGDEGQVGPVGTAFHAVDEHLVARAFRGTSKKKSPGPDGIGPLAIACVYEWDPDRIVALLRAHVRLGYHVGIHTCPLYWVGVSTRLHIVPAIAVVEHHPS